MKPIIVSREEAVAAIPDGATVAIGGGGAGHNVPDSVLEALGARFQRTGTPQGLTVFHPCGIGDAGERGMSHLARRGLLKRVVGGFWGNSLKMVALAQEEEVEAYNFPQGVLSHLMRASASGEPGVITKTGLHTFVDPRLEGGKLNRSAVEDLVEVVTVRGSEFLFYKSPEIDVAIIRGTSADAEGNLTMEEEVGTFAMLSIAQAAKRRRGRVIAQVKRLSPRANELPVHVGVPGVFVDFIVVEPNQGMTFLTPYDSRLITRSPTLHEDSLSLTGIQRIIARRAALELTRGAFVNLGFGMPDGVPIVAREEGVLGELIFMIEQGALGGIPTTGLNFGAMYNPLAILDDGYQFDYFHGGGLDLAFLGFAEVDAEGNVNSSRFGKQITGCGGFIDISQHARRVVFCGSFAVKGKFEVSAGKLRIVEPSQKPKFVERVGQVTFSGPNAARSGQEVLFVTERAVFTLTGKGPVLTEIAPGIDLDRDVLAQMSFVPSIDPGLRRMDSTAFSESLLKLGPRFQAL